MVTVDHEEMVRWISKQTGIDSNIVSRVLESELEYLERLGLVGE
ncbi:hypothetical protein JOE21_003314 [Desmospora profundinema]|uniref:Uncharacterized protein n=1 Tax=Desmospora profundinema TaxID=1571184 RepID=A0ABU1IR81_9BACL|nr:hypothetical protein [Desmospora profundinema]